MLSKDCFEPGYSPLLNHSVHSVQAQSNDRAVTLHKVVRIQRASGDMLKTGVMLCFRGLKEIADQSGKDQCQLCHTV